MVKKKLIVLAGLALSSLLHAQDLFGDDKKSFVLLPAEAISSGVVSKVEFSRTGRFILYQKREIASFELSLSDTPPPAKNEWFRYDRSTKTNQKLLVPESTDEVLTLGDNRSIFFSGHESTDSQGFLDLKSGAITKTSFKLDSITYAGDMPDSPFFIVKVNETSVALVKPSGQTMSIPVPRKLSVFRPLSSDSKSITFTALLQGSPSKLGHLIYSLETGESKFDEKPNDQIRKEMQSDNPRSQFWFENVGELSFVKLLDLPKNLTTDIPTRAKLGTSNCSPQFGPLGDCVAYQDAGALLIREIKPIDFELTKKLLAKAAKTKAMNDAKNAALSLIIYASDMDDVLPGAEGWEAKVKPYCLDESLLRNFNYTFRGGNMASIGNPATTELGFTLGPGGRAVAYCDGHVKWVPNP
ncbi:MAG: hypothetical protein WCI55_02005 [Armatimonadota bacterium]